MKHYCFPLLAFLLAALGAGAHAATTTFAATSEGSYVGGIAPSGFLCAADVSAGQLTIPSCVLLNLAPTGSTPTSPPGQLTVGNRHVNLFTASGLDLGWVGYGETYTLYLKYR